MPADCDPSVFTWRTLTLLTKREWGNGPWVDEPDGATWVDSRTGLACLALRDSGSGAWCGYVAVPAGHPLNGVRHNDDEDPRTDALDALRLHGEVSFSSAQAPRWHPTGDGEKVPDTWWWFGFHCAYADDYEPAREGKLRGTTLRSWWTNESSYRELDYVRDVCESLAVQLAIIGRQEVATPNEPASRQRETPPADPGATASSQA